MKPTTRRGNPGTVAAFAAPSASAPRPKCTKECSTTSNLGPSLLNTKPNLASQARIAIATGTPPVTCATTCATICDGGGRHRRNGAVRKLAEWHPLASSDEYRCVRRCRTKQAVACGLTERRHEARAQAHWKFDLTGGARSVFQSKPERLFQPLAKAGVHVFELLARPPAVLFVAGFV